MFYQILIKKSFEKKSHSVMKMVENTGEFEQIVEIKVVMLSTKAEASIKWEGDAAVDEFAICSSMLATSDHPEYPFVSQWTTGASTMEAEEEEEKLEIKSFLCDPRVPGGRVINTPGNGATKKKEGIFGIIIT